MSSSTLYIEAGINTPEVNFKPGKLVLYGESFPENPSGFYQPILNWLGNYSKSDYVRKSQNKTEFICNVSYFNTGSRVFIMQIIDYLNQLYNSSHKVGVKWYYDQDEDNLDEELDLKFSEIIEDFQLPIAFVPLD